MELAKHDLNLAPPEFSVRMVRASFAMRNVESVQGGKVQLAMLVMDSRQQPAVAGVRGGSPAVRQLLYKAGTVCIDLHIRPKPGSESVELVGQLLDSVKPTRILRNIPVTLLQHGNSVSNTKTNDSGEFDFGFDLPEDVHLAVGLKNRTLVVPIPDAEIETRRQ
ncbi:MAG TPA: hypothetical protein VEF05_08170 [Terriglobales bacterium]|nr:hypothetical protein [Terriglobales bacterium]